MAVHSLRAQDTIVLQQGLLVLLAAWKGSSRKLTQHR
jgi:hypothetical protein